MLKNIYAPLSGGVVQERVMEVIANNLANVNTTAFKEDHVSAKAEEANPWPNYPSPLPPAAFKLDMRDLNPLHGNEMGYVSLSNVKTAFDQGALIKTDNDTHIAIEGDGFFEVQTPFGLRYTRDGSFNISTDGCLVTKNGAVVAGESGPITNLGKENLKILDSGEVYNGDKFIDKIKLVSFQKTENLERLGENLWVYNGDPSLVASSKANVTQGYLEGSNVNPMRNLTNMIVAHRNYEALQKTVKAHDETMQNANKISEFQ